MLLALVLGVAGAAVVLDTIDKPIGPLPAVVPGFLGTAWDANCRYAPEVLAVEVRRLAGPDTIDCGVAAIEDEEAVTQCVRSAFSARRSFFARYPQAVIHGCQEISFVLTPDGVLLRGWLDIFAGCSFGGCPDWLQTRECESPVMNTTLPFRRLELFACAGDDSGGEPDK